MKNSLYTTSANGGLTVPAEVEIATTAINGNSVNPPLAGKVVK